MDRRSLFAIILTFGILIAWEALYMAPKRSELARKQAAALAERKRADSLAALEQPAPPETVATAPAPRDTARAARPDAAPGAFLGEAAAAGGAPRVTIATDLLRVVLSAAGAEVESLTLAEFDRKDGSAVELVPAGAAGGMRLAVLEGGDWRSLSGSVFETFVDGTPVSGDAEVALGEGRETAEVVFRLTGPDGELVEKSFTFSRGSYDVALRVSIQRAGALARSSAYSIGWECGLSTTESDARADRAKFAALGGVGAERYKIDMNKFGKETRRSYEGTVVWGAARTKYFLSALIATGEGRGSGTLALLGDRANGFIGFSIASPFRGDPRLVEDAYSWYAGPLDMKRLRSYNVGLEKAIDLGWLRFLSAGILRLMVWMNRGIPNYGVIIIIFSVLTKLLFYRLTHKSFKSMKDMQRLQPRIKEIQEKFKNDRDKLNKEVMKAYKEAGVNPLGGCLPLLFQMPVFIALYNALSNTIELRGAPFFGWIKDLSMPDTLFRWGASIPFIGNEFHLLPILMGGAMVAQSRLGGSPTGDGAPAMQTKMMNYMMPIIFTIFFYGMPSGLVLYWLVNQVLSVAQQYIVQREIEGEERSAADAAVGAGAPAGAGGADPGTRAAHAGDGGAGRRGGKRRGQN